MPCNRAGLLAAALAIFLAAPDSLAEAPVPAAFRQSSENETVFISYADWSHILDATVFDAGRSDRSLAPQPKPGIGRHMVRGNKSPYRYEGNRLSFPMLRGDNLATLSRIRREIEAMPGAVPLAEWTRDQQLAYWLNLYNITLIEQLAIRYPETSLKRVLYGRRGLLDEKLLQVAGVRLSLNDIQHRILVPGWQDPMVMYGLFQGYVGSPNVRKEAYTAANVHRLLADNAAEFINSNRGARMDGDTLEVAELYRENAALFPDFETDVKSHVARFADAEFAERVRSARRLEASTRDYYIADLYQGVIDDTNPNAGNPAIFASLSGEAQLFFDTKGATTLEVNLPPAFVREYVIKILEKKAGKEGRVEVEEYQEKTGKTDEEGKNRP
ncbi:MAG: DUF547 domain-containing protein [Alphaproteobacteria bacterium]|nr:MAG: DUF547 domain-containing protein [Alphaproteobacteria bacterium]